MYIGGNGWIVENCITDAIYLSENTVSTGTIRNNIIATRIGALSLTTTPGLLVDHNIIYSSTTNPLNNLQSATFTNNIFFGVDPSTSTVDYCTFNNNMAIGATLGTFPGGTSTGSGNVSALFSNYQFNHTLTSSSLTFVQIVSNDWHLRSTSLGHNTGLDGTDMGIYGGSNPMPNFTGTPGTIPQMTLITILTPNISAGTPINVRFKARKVN